MRFETVGRLKKARDQMTQGWLTDLDSGDVLKAAAVDKYRCWIRKSRRQHNKRLLLSEKVESNRSRRIRR